MAGNFWRAGPRLFLSKPSRAVERAIYALVKGNKMHRSPHLRFVAPVLMVPLLCFARQGSAQVRPNNAPYRPDQTVAAKETDLYLGLLERDYLQLKQYLRAKNYEEALQFFAGLQTRYPQRAGIFYHTGFVYRQMENRRKAEEAFLRAIVLAPDDPATRTALGIVYQQQGRYADAADTFRAALRIDSLDPSAWNSLGLTYKMSGDNAAALQSYRAGREARLHPVRPHSSLGGLTPR